MPLLTYYIKESHLVSCLLGILHPKAKSQFGVEGDKDIIL